MLESITIVEMRHNRHSAAVAKWKFQPTTWIAPYPTWKKNRTARALRDKGRKLSSGILSMGRFFVAKTILNFRRIFIPYLQYKFHEDHWLRLTKSSGVNL